MGGAGSRRADALITLERLIIVILSTWKWPLERFCTGGPFAICAGISADERGYTTNMR